MIRHKREILIVCIFENLTFISFYIFLYVQLHILYLFFIVYRLLFYSLFILFLNCNSLYHPINTLETLKIVTLTIGQELNYTVCCNILNLTHCTTNTSTWILPRIKWNIQITCTRTLPPVWWNVQIFAHGF